jgi:hypothetical protein
MRDPMPQILLQEPDIRVPDLVEEYGLAVDPPAQRPPPLHFGCAERHHRCEDQSLPGSSFEEEEESER